MQIPLRGNKALGQKMKVLTWILHGSEAFICKAFKDEVVLLILRALNNAADGSFRVARRVKINGNKIDQNPNYR
jgi:hypothetical protein